MALRDTVHHGRKARQYGGQDKEEDGLSHYLHTQEVKRAHEVGVGASGTVSPDRRTGQVEQIKKLQKIS